MNRDIALWKNPNGLTEDERLIVKRNLGFFVTADSLAANNIVLGTTATSRRRSAASTCCARRSRRRSTRTPTSTSPSRSGSTRARSCGVQGSEVHPRQGRLPHPLHRDAHRPSFKTAREEADRQLLKSLIVFACIMEGLFFYVGFVQICRWARQNKMTGAAEQYQYILRDESMHCNFGIDLINTIKMEKPESLGRRSFGAS